jgi:hypothetical protein
MWGRSVYAHLPDEHVTGVSLIEAYVRILATNSTIAFEELDGETYQTFWESSLAAFAAV